jgi:hypothetical protein
MRLRRTTTTLHSGPVHEIVPYKPQRRCQSQAERAHPVKMRRVNASYLFVARQFVADCVRMMRGELADRRRLDLAEEQKARPGNRYAAAPAMMLALCPPKPKLFDITIRSFFSRGVFGV